MSQAPDAAALPAAPAPVAPAPVASAPEASAPEAAGPLPVHRHGGGRASQLLPRRGIERLDLMLLCVEALDFNGGEAMVWMCENLGFSPLFPNRVELWKRRCHNPLRRITRRGALAEVETDALITILTAMAERLYPMLRQLLSSAEPPELAAQRWQLVQERLAELVQERLNLRRGAVQRLLDPQEGPGLCRQLVQGLAFASGPGGFDRLKASLLDAAA